MRWATLPGVSDGPEQHIIYMSEKKDLWDIAFLVSGKPVPAVLDMACHAQRTGRRAIMIILDRGVNDLTVDPAFVTFEIRAINVSYQRVSASRVFSIPRVYRAIRSILLPGLKPDAIICTAGYDLLVLARILCIGRHYRLRHQVRDLHQLQLSGGATAWIFKTLERIMLRRVEQLIVSSPKFHEAYYREIYSGRVVLLENTPARRTWTGFRRFARKDGAFHIGFIGIIRYEQSLRQLATAAKNGAAEGRALRVIFAGGTANSALLKEIADSPMFEVLGAYEYTRDIQRLYANVDLIYAVYDSYDRNCQLAMPNKFYEAIIAKIPIVVAKNTFVEAEVLRLGIGASVVSGDSDGLLQLLRDVDRADGWYMKACARLEELDAESYFVAYGAALSASVLDLS